MFSSIQHLTTVRAYVLLLLLSSTLAIGFQDVDSTLTTQARAGEEQYKQLLTVKTKLPQYGQCWKKSLSDLETGCKKLTDEIQMRLAIQFTNCFLLQNGRPMYKCEPHMNLKDCTQYMTDSAFSTYQSFFTHTHNMCFFLQSQVWQEQTEGTISRLSDTSNEVASKLEESTHIQGELLDKQKLSLEKQKLMIDKNDEMQQTIELSTSNVKILFEDYKQTTKQQRVLIGEVFDKVTRLQSLVLGEFTGLYSIIFYVLSLMISYLVTCTPRTACARFFIFVVMTLNMVVERIIVQYAGDGQTDQIQLDPSTLIYNQLWICRKTSCAVATFILMYSCYLYKDYNTINNLLLQDIKQQNAELKTLLNFANSGNSNARLMGNGSVSLAALGNNSSFLTGDSGHETESDEDSGSDSNSSLSDHTFVPDDLSVSNYSDTSFRTTGSSRESTPALLEELRNLREATPLRHMGMSPLGQSTPLKATPNCQSSFVQDDHCEPNSVYQRYNLRSRSRTNSPNPLTKTESPGQFQREVKQLAMVSAQNSFTTHLRLKDSI